MNDLTNLQISFQNYLMNKQTKIEQSITKTENVSIEKRLGIYANAYRSRLIESLANTYPLLKQYVIAHNDGVFVIGRQQYLGDDSFQKIALDYLASNPSSYYSIRWFGDNFANYLAQNDSYPPYLSELAQFEWQLGLCFDASDDTVLTLDQIANIPPESWPKMRFTVHSSLQRSNFSWTVVPLWQALSGKKIADEPQKTAQKTSWVIWRSNYVNHFNSLLEEEAWALDTLITGETFGEICAGLCKWHDEQQVGLHAASLLKGWVQGGLLAQVHTK